MCANASSGAPLLPRSLCLTLGSCATFPCHRHTANSNSCFDNVLLCKTEMKLILYCITQETIYNIDRLQLERLSLCISVKDFFVCEHIDMLVLLIFCFHWMHYLQM